MARIGELLAGRYRIDDRIGSGGFATVFRAHDLRLDRDVAVKVLLPNHADDPVIAARFDREARALAAVSHPNVVGVHDVEPGDPATGAEPFLVMDLCEGGSLAELLAASETGGLPPDELVPILVEVAAGLDALHAQGIVHRDLKPSNVLFADGRARIADLGIAAAEPSELTLPGTTVGTLAYLAPEQLAGEPASPATDVHALGAIAFLGLTGRLPRPAGSVAELAAGTQLAAPPVSEAEPDLGPAFDEPVAAALGQDPSARPTAAEFGTWLDESLDRWLAEPGSAPAEAALSPDDTTVTDLAPVGDDVPFDAAAGRGLSALEGLPAIVDRHLGTIAWLVAGVILGLAALLVLGSIVPGPERGAGTTSSAAPPTASATPSPSPSPTPTPTATPAPTPTPTAVSGPYDAARAASANMHAAISAARGSGGLNGKEAKDLETPLNRFDKAIDQRDAETAREQAAKVQEAVARLVERHQVDQNAGVRLTAAADRLVAAAEALPD